MVILAYKMTGNTGHVRPYNNYTASYLYHLYKMVLSHDHRADHMADHMVVAYMYHKLHM